MGTHHGSRTYPRSNFLLFLLLCAAVAAVILHFPIGCITIVMLSGNRRSCTASAVSCPQIVARILVMPRCTEPAGRHLSTGRIQVHIQTPWLLTSVVIFLWRSLSSPIAAAVRTGTFRRYFSLLQEEFAARSQRRRTSHSFGPYALEKRRGPRSHPRRTACFVGAVLCIYCPSCYCCRCLGILLGSALSSSRLSRSTVDPRLPIACSSFRAWS